MDTYTGNNGVSSGLTDISNNTGLLNSSSSELKKTLVALFKSVNVDESSLSRYTSQKTILSNKIKQIEEKMETLKAKIAEKQEEIQEQSEAITKLVEKATQKSIQLKEEQKKATSKATNEVIEMYKSGKITREQFASTLKSKIKGNLSSSSTSKDIESIINELDNKSVEIESLANNISTLSSEKTTLQNQFVSLKSSYNLLSKVINNANNSKIGKNGIPTYDDNQTTIIASLIEKHSGIATQQEQIDCLNNNQATILQELFENNFSFEQAMYVLFDKNSGIFKNSGITYNAEKGEYSIDEVTKEMYPELCTALVDNIKNKWDVLPEGYDNVVELSSDDVNSAIIDAQSEANSHFEDISIENLNTSISQITNIDEIKGEVENIYTQAKDSVESYNSSQVAQINSESKNYSKAGIWDNVKDTLASLASENGFELDEDDWSNLREIYDSNHELSSQDIFNSYKNELEAKAAKKDEENKNSINKTKEENQDESQVNTNSSDFINSVIDKAKKEGLENIKYSTVTALIKSNPNIVDVDTAVKYLLKAQ